MRTGGFLNTQLHWCRALIRDLYLDILLRAVILLPRVITLPLRAAILPLRCVATRNPTLYLTDAIRIYEKALGQPTSSTTVNSTDECH